MWGTGIAPLPMVISETVFQGMALGKIIKVKFYGLFQSLDLPSGVRLFQSVSQGRCRSNKPKQFMADSPLGGTSGQGQEGGEGQAPLGQHAASPQHLPRPRPPPQDYCPQALPSPPLGARQPRRTHRPFGRRTRQFLIGGPEWMWMRG